MVLARESTRVVCLSVMNSASLRDAEVYETSACVLALADFNVSTVHIASLGEARLSADRSWFR